MTDPSTRPQHPISRRRLLFGLAVGAGAIGASRLTGPLGGQLASAVDPELVALTGPGSALETADRLGPPPGPDPAPTGPPPPGKLIFPLQPGASCGFHDDSYYHPRGTSRTHLALDIMSTAGQPVYAVCDGVLTNRYTSPDPRVIGAGWGWTLEDSASNRRYKYFHCAEDANGLVIGDTVRLGDVIGFVGDSGTSVGNFHLHFEVWEGTSRRLDPYQLLDVPDTCSVW